MQKLFAEQLAKAKTPSGEIDIDALGRLVVAAYEGMDAARRGTEHSIAAMVERSIRRIGSCPRPSTSFPKASLFSMPRAVSFTGTAASQRFTTPRATRLSSAEAGRVLRAGAERGLFPDALGREEEWLTERLGRNARSSNNEEQKLASGRWVRIEERRTADGGSIGARIDITELKKREESSVCCSTPIRSRCGYGITKPINSWPSMIRHSRIMVTAANSFSACACWI